MLILELQEKLDSNLAESQLEKNRLQQQIKILEDRINDGEKDFLHRESALQKRELHLEVEQRRFETEKDLTMQRLTSEGAKLKVFLKLFLLEFLFPSIQ